MHYWSQYPFIRLTLLFIAGIYTTYKIPAPYPLIWTIWTCSLISYLVLIKIRTLYNNLTNLPYLLGGIATINLYLAGAIAFLNHQEKDELAALQQIQKSHIKAYEAVITEVPVTTKTKHTRLIVTLRRAYINNRWQPVHNKVQLTIQEAQPSPLSYGDLCIILGSPQPVKQSTQLSDFDYKTFLALDNLFWQHNLSPKAIQKISYQPPNKIKAWIIQLRNKAKKIISKNIQADRERGIILALVLGIKEDLLETIRNAYVATGTMHVLAVSGLHVGILYTLLNFLLQKLPKTLRNKKKFTTLLIMLCLWIYAAITGFSPSVFRATVMLNLVLIAKFLKKSTAIYNTLAASAFLLLAWNPAWLFSASFQLSYSAVVGIIYLQPKIYKGLVFKNKILNQLWLWTSISLAAQGATTLVSLSYFHQFPVYFVVTNWIVVPAAFLIFSMGLLLLLLSPLTPLSTPLGYTLEKFTWLINELVQYTTALPYSVIDHIFITHTEMWLYVTLVGSILWLLYAKKTQGLYLATFLTCCLISTKLYKNSKHHHQKSLTLHYEKDELIITLTKGSYGLFLHKGPTDKKLNFYTKIYQQTRGIQHYQTIELTENLPSTIPIQHHSNQTVGVWGGKKFIIIEQPIPKKLPPKEKINTDYLIIPASLLNNLPTIMDHFIVNHLIILNQARKNLNRKGHQPYLQDKKWVTTYLTKGEKWEATW